MKKNHVCPSGSLRVNKKNQNTKRDKEEKNKREKNKTDDQPSLVFSSKNHRNECIRHGTEHGIYSYITLYYLGRGTVRIGLQLRWKKKSLTTRLNGLLLFIMLSLWEYYKKEKRQRVYIRPDIISVFKCQVHFRRCKIIQFYSWICLGTAKVKNQFI